VEGRLGFQYEYPFRELLARFQNEAQPAGAVLDEAALADEYRISRVTKEIVWESRILM
jgi:hypothetical protein